MRNGKSGKDRRTLLPERLPKELRNHLEEVRQLHKRDLMVGWGQVALPSTLARKVPMPLWNGAGSGCFQRGDGRTGPPENRAAITSIAA